jgi:hypothetical protein
MVVTSTMSSQLTKIISVKSPFSLARKGFLFGSLPAGGGIYYELFSQLICESSFYFLTFAAPKRKSPWPSGLR